jgi:putative transcriptional regulator
LSNHLELKNHLKHWRKSCTLTQAQLAEVVEVSRKSINAVENGIYIPSTVLALKIADALNCTVHDLFELPVKNQ